MEEEMGSFWEELCSAFLEFPVSLCLSQITNSQQSRRQVCAHRELKAHTVQVLVQYAHQVLSTAAL